MNLINDYLIRLDKEYAMKAAGYVRVSTADQVTNSQSLQMQEEKIKQYCTLRDWIHIKTYVEPGISGSTMERPALLALLQAAKRHEFEVVIVNDLSRFGRNLLHLKQNTELLKELKIKFVSVREGVDGTTGPIGDLLVNILASIYEFERENIFERTHVARRILNQRHECFVGHLPFGYMWDDDGVKIIQHPTEGPIYQRMVSDYLNLDLSLRDIAINLNRERVPTRLGGRWHAGSLSTLFSYTLHYGSMVTNTKVLNEKGKPIGDKPEEEHVYWEAEPLITRSEWLDLQEKLSKASTRSGPTSKYEDQFLLIGLVRCGLCGAAITPIVYHGKRIYACRLRVTGRKELQVIDREKCSLPRLNADDLENWVYTILKSKLKANPDETYGLLIQPELWNEKIQDSERIVETIQSEIDKQKRGLKRLKLAVTEQEDDDFDLAFYKSQIREINQNIRKLKGELQEQNDKLEHFLKLRNDQEKLAQLVDNEEQMLRLREKIRNLQFAEKKRLIRGLLDGPIVIPPPIWTEEEREQLGKDRYQLTICNSARITFRYNQPILKEILGISKQLGKS